MLKVRDQPILIRLPANCSRRIPRSRARSLRLLHECFARLQENRVQYPKPLQRGEETLFLPCYYNYFENILMKTCNRERRDECLAIEDVVMNELQSRTRL